MISTIGNYPYVTIVQDAMGCLHIFKNVVTVEQLGADRIVKEGTEQDADFYIQAEPDVRFLLEGLTESEKMLIAMGHEVSTKGVCDSYFPKNCRAGAKVPLHGIVGALNQPGQKAEFPITPMVDMSSVLDLKIPIS